MSDHQESRDTREMVTTPMVPTTESTYQQTELVYKPKSEHFYNKIKIKNPLKMPAALINPDRTPKQQNRFRMAVINQQQDHSPPSGPLSPADYYSSADEDDQPPLVLDPNIYSTKKTVMTILCLIIIIMANSMQLKFVLKNTGAVSSQFYSVQIGLGITSVLLAASIGILLMYSARLNFNDAYKQRKLDFLNNIAMILLFILTILNIFLVAMN